jgi:phosphatidylserine/phosphatidylglycerophosphate/cardiolipin synthase-like enzyme
VVDHPPLLANAVKNAQQRLLIFSPWISGAVITYKFLNDLEATLRRGVKVYIGYGISGDENRSNEDSRGIRLLMGLSGKFSNFILTRLGNTHAKVLIKDSEFAATTSFNWLSFKGDPNRTFRDEQGVLITKALEVDRKFNELVSRFPIK